MGKLFGTDGIRGVVGENLTADMAFRVGQAVGTVLMEDKGSRPTVVIGTPASPPTCWSPR